MNPNEPPKENTTGFLRLFVYGTLKRGYWNHERFCRGVLSVEEAVVRGRLYEFPSGIPVLEVPEADVLAHGTADPLADVATQARLAAEFAARAAHPELGENGAPGGRWGPVYLSAVLRSGTGRSTTSRASCPCLRRGRDRQAADPASTGVCWCRQVHEDAASWSGFTWRAPAGAILPVGWRMVSGEPREGVFRTNRQDSRFGRTEGAPGGCEPGMASIKSLDTNCH
jgi:hypothetical protein